MLRELNNLGPWKWKKNSEVWFFWFVGEMGWYCCRWNWKSWLCEGMIVYRTGGLARQKAKCSTQTCESKKSWAVGVCVGLSPNFTHFTICQATRWKSINKVWLQADFFHLMLRACGHALRSCIAFGSLPRWSACSAGYGMIVYKLCS